MIQLEMLHEISQILISNPIFFWILALITFLIRPTLPIIQGHYGLMKSNSFTNTERENRKEKRNHNIVLATFTLVVLSLMLNLTSDNFSYNLNSFLFFSTATFVFFTATCLFDVIWNRMILHIALSAEYAGIILVAAGFYYYVVPFHSESIVTFVYLSFVCAIFLITAIDAIKKYANMPRKRR